MHCVDSASCTLHPVMILRTIHSAYGYFSAENHQPAFFPFLLIFFFSKKVLYLQCKLHAASCYDIDNDP